MLTMDDSSSPATKADIQELANTMQQGFDGMDRKFNKVWEYMDRMMAALTSIDDRLQQRTSDHERRITRLEREVGVRS